MKAAPKLIFSSFLFLSLYAAWGQQVVAQSVGTTDVASTDTTTQSEPEASADDSSDVEEEIDFGFAVDPGFVLPSML